MEHRAARALSVGCLWALGTGAGGDAINAPFSISPSQLAHARDPRFIREFKAKHCVEAMVEHVTQKKKRKLWRKKDQKFEYPYKEIGPVPK